MTVIVCGPPCAGKTTWVQHHAQLGDIVLDFDAYIAEVTGTEVYAAPPPAWAVEQWQRVTRRPLASGYLIRTAPQRSYRGMLRRIHQATTAVLETPASVCLDRLAKTDRPEWAKQEQAQAIRRWWAEYERSANDVVIRP